MDFDSLELVFSIFTSLVYCCRMSSSEWQAMGCMRNGVSLAHYPTLINPLTGGPKISWSREPIVSICSHSLSSQPCQAVSAAAHSATRFSPSCSSLRYLLPMLLLASSSNASADHQSLGQTGSFVFCFWSCVTWNFSQARLFLSTPIPFVGVSIHLSQLTHLLSLCRIADQCAAVLQGWGIWAEDWRGAIRSAGSVRRTESQRWWPASSCHYRWPWPEQSPGHFFCHNEAGECEVVVGMCHSFSSEAGCGS